jgi:hypothetical protein
MFHDRLSPFHARVRDWMPRWWPHLSPGEWLILVLCSLLILAGCGTTRYQPDSRADPVVIPPELMREIPSPVWLPTDRALTVADVLNNLADNAEIANICRAQVSAWQKLARGNRWVD